MVAPTFFLCLNQTVISFLMHELELQWIAGALSARNWPWINADSQKIMECAYLRSNLPPKWKFVIAAVLWGREYIYVCVFCRSKLLHRTFTPRKQQHSFAQSPHLLAKDRAFKQSIKQAAQLLNKDKSPNDVHLCHVHKAHLSWSASRHF